MERKYSVVLCCLALLFLGSLCFAGNTPWVKHHNSTFTGQHLFFNTPNAQGPNGEGDSCIMNYPIGDLKTNDLIVGINVEAYDWNVGALTLKFKALEMRYEGLLTGCPDWTTAGLVQNGTANVATVTPVPYIWNWPNLNQYAFPNAFYLGGGASLNTMAVVQYGPGQNQATGATGGPVCGYDGGPASLDSFGWDALNQACNGPYAIDFLLCLYGNPGLPPVYPDLNMFNRKYNVNLQRTALVQGAGIKATIHLVNSTGLAVPSLISFWVRAGGWQYQGFAATGVDVFSVVTGGGYTNPIPLNVPPISYSVSIPLNLNMGGLAEFAFSNWTWECIMEDANTPQTWYESWVKDTLICPKGCQDDNSADLYWAIQTPPTAGDAMAKRIWGPILPSGAFTITNVNWSPSDFVGNGNALYAADIRWEGTFGDRTPDCTPAGLIGTFDPASVPIGTLYSAAVQGGAGLAFAGPPATNIYGVCWYNFNLPVNDVYVASDLSGFNHKYELKDTAWSLGGGTGPQGTTVPFNKTADLLILRLQMTEPLDSTLGTVDAKPALKAEYAPTKGTL